MILDKKKRLSQEVEQLLQIGGDGKGNIFFFPKKKINCLDGQLWFVSPFLFHLVLIVLGFPQESQRFFVQKKKNQKLTTCSHHCDLRPYQWIPFLYHMSSSIFWDVDGTVWGAPPGCTGNAQGYTISREGFCISKLNF